MKPNRKLALAALIGVAAGVAGVKAIQAGQVKTAPAYLIAEVEVTDPAAFQKYAEKVADTLAPFNAQYVVRGGKTVALEGEAPKRITVIAFDSMEKAKGWYDSPAYAAIRPMRQNASKSRLILAEGVAPR